MSDIWFTSDPHYFHANVIRYCNRPFESVIEMNEKMIKNWNSVVKPEDTVYCLGDFSLAARPVEVITPRLMGNKFLIPGNHDFCHSFNKKSRNSEKRQYWLDFYARNGWTVLPEFYEMDIEGVAIVNMCHIPYNTQDPRYKDHQLKDDGRWLLCGHVHEKWKLKDKMINVGVDVWDMKPVHIDEIKKIILEGTNE